jgi:hypothetical protein
VKLLNADGIVAILDLHWSDGLYTGPSAITLVDMGKRSGYAGKRSDKLRYNFL